jgi:hypothetical protein
MLLDETPGPKGWHETFRGAPIETMATLAPGWSCVAVFTRRPIPVWALSIFLALAIGLLMALLTARWKDTPLR